MLSANKMIVVASIAIGLHLAWVIFWATKADAFNAGAGSILLLGWVYVLIVFERRSKQSMRH